MKYCPACGAGIFNSNLPKCPMCGVELEKASAPSDLLTRPELSTKWASVLCVLLIINSIVTMVEGFFILRLKTSDYLTLYGIAGAGVESLENFMGFGYFIFTLLTGVSVYGIFGKKKMGPIFLYVMHGIVISSCIMYMINIYDLTYIVDGLKIKAMVPAELAIHTVLFPVNFFYFRKRKNVYDDVF